MNKNLSRVLSFLGLSSPENTERNSQAKLYKTGAFSVEYPSSWQMMSNKEILNFFPKDNHGIVTISSYGGINFVLEKTRNFILEMNGIEDEPEAVEMTTKGEIVEFLYEHTNKEGKWYTKAIRRNKDFFLLTINCELNKWNTEKDMFLNVVNSFKMNNIN